MPTFRDRLLVLRHTRLGRVPPGQHSTQILQEEGFSLVVLEYGEISPPPPEPGLPKVRLSTPWAAWLPRRLRSSALFLSALFRLAWRFIDDRPSLVITHGLNEQALIHFLHRLFKVPFACHVHEIFDESELTPLNRFFLRLEGRTLRAASFLIFPDPDRARIYQERYAITCPIYSVPNCARLRDPGSRRKTDWHPASPAKLMLYCGGIGETNAISEMVSLLPEFPELHFWIVGWSDEGASEALLAHCRSLGVAERVKLWGVVEDKWEYLDSADIGYCVYRVGDLRTRHIALPSNKLMEAMAAGLPILAARPGGFGPVVEGEGIGVCAEDTSVPALRDALHRLLDDPSVLSACAQKAKKLHRERYHYEAQFRPVLKALRQILGTKRTSVPADLASVKRPA